MKKQEIKDYKVLYEKEKSVNEYLIKQQRELKELAERQGSEKAVFEHECVRLKEYIKKLEGD